jgi:hypothetical protein
MTGTVAATIVTTGEKNIRKVSLLQDQENGIANVVAAITGSWEMKESELLLLNHEKCGRKRIWNHDTLIELKSNYCNCYGDHEKVYSLHPLQS